MSKDKKICLLVPNNPSISDEEDDNNSDYEICDDEDQGISEKGDTSKEDKTKMMIVFTFVIKK